MPNNEPLAIVGMACRFPGGANHPAALWELLRAGVDAVAEVPATRWNAERFHHASAAAPGRMVTKWGGFVANVDGIDAAFFGIAPREAARMEPQHRWLAEVTWEAMEDAGVPPERLAGTRTGVFLGISSSDYLQLSMRDLLAIDGYTNIGGALSIAANRLSFLYNLRGPSLAVDTACSSSLVALHLAARSLWTGECAHAIVAGANALLTPHSSIGFSHAHMLSPSGRCRAFDAKADGYVRAEGAAAVLLMPLRAAQSMGLHPRALILATASNQDGRSSSLTVPNQSAQEEMIREALSSSQRSARDVGYVEAHGTGTQVGDPIEAKALAAVLGAGRPAGERLLVGSVKTNLGHLEPASGLAGLMKAVLVLEHREVPPSLHFATPNPHLPLDRVSIPTTVTPLPVREGRAPLVAVNSFGFGGANAHAILAAAEPRESTPDDAAGACILPLSARHPAALAAYADAFADFIEAEPSLSLREICAAAALGKSHHPLRRALVADSIDALQSQLKAVRVAPDPAAPAPPKVAFVFSGQGPQWWAMGRQLYRDEKAVRDVWERCDAVCRAAGGPKILEALLATESASVLHLTEFAQPALFTLQAGLVELWRSWGIEADAMLGHSVGEAAAAWASGCCDLETTFRVIVARSRLQERMRGRGRMLAAAMTPGEAREWEQKYEGSIFVAAFNSPRQVTLSGDPHALDAIAVALGERDVFHRFLATDYAFHSAQMESIEAELRAALAEVRGRDGRVPMVSTVTGAPVRGAQLDADYWWRNVRQPVRFDAAVTHLLDEGFNVFLEIGPHPVMSAALAELILGRKAPAVTAGSLRRDQDERATMLRALATLYGSGAQVRWESLYSRPSRRVTLPAYPWQRQHLWAESADAALVFRRPPAHPLLGDRQPQPEPNWLSRLDARLVPWLAEHRLGGSAVLPAAAYVEMAAAAVRELLGEPTILLEELRFHRMLTLPEEQPISVWTQLDPAASAFRIFSAPPDDPTTWTLHAEGIYRPGRMHAPPPVELAQLRAALPEERDPRELYRDAEALGQVFGPAFQGLKSLRVHGGEALGEVDAGGAGADAGYLLFPPLVDSCFHPCGGLIRELTAGSQAVVVAFARVQLFRALPQKVWSHFRVREFDGEHAVGDVTICDDTGAVVACVTGMTVRRLATSRAGREQRFFRPAWEPAEALHDGGDAGTGECVLIFADRTGTGRLVASALRARKIAAKLVFAAPGAVEEVEDAIVADMAAKDWAARLWEGFAAAGPLPSRMIYLWSREPGSEARESCANLLALIQARIAIEPDVRPARWLVVTRPDDVPQAAVLWGFVRTVQTELPQWRVSLVECADETPAEALLAELHASGIEPEVRLAAQSRQVRRLRPFQPELPASLNPPPAFGLEIGQAGRTDALRFRGRPRPAPGAGEIEVEVAAAGLNFRDLMKVLGIYPTKSGESVTLGDEFSGRVARLGRGVEGLAAGDRVMGFAPAGGAFSSHLVVAADAVWKIPGDLSFAEAASIPVAFGTAYYALSTLARLQAGETVLIHAAAGGVGLAAVRLAQEIGAVVFATAGSAEKREYLRSLGVACVMDSRTLDFADETLRQTSGRGVDVVLNSLAGAFQQKSLAVCASHGRFVEIGKRDLFEGHSLPLAAFQRSLTFSAFDLGAVIAARGEEWPALRRFFVEEFAPGRLEPTRCTRIPAVDVVAGFRLMQGAQHIGKVVIEFEGGRPEVVAEFWPNPEGTYLVTGGFSGLGLETARWLAERGARHLALLSRKGAPSPENAPKVEELRARGISVTALAVDVADREALATALRSLADSAPALRGIFHSAMVTRDRTLATMSAEDLHAVLAPKVAGAWNLHLETRELPLECFVMFSSIAALVGSQGQANYAAANAFLDALAHFRRSCGLPATTVNWGQIAEVGVAAQRPELRRYLDTVGLRGITPREAMAALAGLIGGPEPQVAVIDVDWERLGKASANVGSSPVFGELTGAARSGPGSTGVASEWRKNVMALPEEQRLPAVAEMITAQIAATLGLAPSQVDPRRPLVQFGMDSLMAVELKARIESHSGVELPIHLFSADLAAGTLAARFLQHMAKAEPAGAPTPPAGAKPDSSSAAAPVAAPPELPADVPPMVADPPQASAAQCDVAAGPASPHWTHARNGRPQFLLHPLQGARARDILRSLHEYGGLDRRPQFMLRALTMMCGSVARSPLRAIESWRVRRWIDPVPIMAPPVFIIGHWRSGTTHLHRLLSQDPQFACVTLVRAAAPLEFVTVFHRLAIAALGPARRPMDAMRVSPDAPEEEELAMSAAAPLSFFHAFYFPRDGRRIYREAVHFDGVAPERIEDWWRRYISFLKKVQANDLSRRLLIKNPANTARIAALRARFPGARFIHIHRHPEEVYASTLLLHRRLQEAWALQEDTVEHLRTTVLENYADLMTAYFEQARELPDRELIEVRLSDLEAQPLATLESIYRQLEMGDFDAASPRFAAYLEKMGTFEKNRLSLTSEERRAVRTALEPVYERWGYR